MKILQLLCIIVAVIVAGAIVYPLSRPEPSLPPETLVANNPANVPARVEPSAPAPVEPSAPARIEANEPAQAEATELAKTELAKTELAKAEPEASPAEDAAAETAPANHDLPYLAYYAYSEVPPDIKPADSVLESLKDIPVGSPIEEITHASEAFGLDVTFMKTVAKSPISIPSSAPDPISACSSSATTSSTNTVPATSPIRATMPSRRPTNSPPRPSCSRLNRTRRRRATISI